jgi:hypothetical protein
MKAVVEQSLRQVPSARRLIIALFAQRKTNHVRLVATYTPPGHGREHEVPALAQRSRTKEKQA